MVSRQHFRSLVSVGMLASHSAQGAVMTNDEVFQDAYEGLLADLFKVLVDETIIETDKGGKGNVKEVHQRFRSAVKLLQECQRKASMLIEEPGPIFVCKSCATENDSPLCPCGSTWSFMKVEK